MHVISIERALSHWQALNRLPVSAANFLETRFLREQPVLASVFLPPPNDPATVTEKVPDFDDPAMADFRRLTGTGAILSEIFRREAGRPLRQVTVEELDAISAELAALVGESEPAGTGREKRSPQLLETCSQGPLLCGAAAAYLGENQTKRKGLAREVLGLRIT
jgi:hypothetical protein